MKAFKIGDKVRFKVDKDYNVLPMQITKEIKDGELLPNGAELNVSGKVVYVMTALSGFFFGINFVGTAEELMPI